MGREEQHRQRDGRTYRQVVLSRAPGQVAAINERLVAAHAVAQNLKIDSWIKEASRKVRAHETHRLPVDGRRSPESGSPAGGGGGPSEGANLWAEAWRTDSYHVGGVAVTPEYLFATLQKTAREPASQLIGLRAIANFARFDAS